MKAIHQITGEKLIRSCQICKSEEERCNYCQWNPVDMSQHKRHVVSWTQQTDRNVSWIGKLFGKKPIHVKQYCHCGALMREYNREGMIEITI